MAVKKTDKVDQAVEATEEVAETEKAEATEKVAKAVKAEKAEPKKKEAPKKEASFFMYLGPTIHGVIETASIYPGPLSEVEKKLSGAIEKFPRIKALLVSGDTIAEDRIQVTKPGTRLNTEYHRLTLELKK